MAPKNENVTQNAIIDSFKLNIDQECKGDSDTQIKNFEDDLVMKDKIRKD